MLFCQTFDWLAGEFVGDATATPGGTAFVTATGGGGGAIEASLSRGPAGPDCIDCDSKLCDVGGITGSGRETGSTGPDGMAVANGISICAGLGTVTTGRAGSGTTVAVAAVGAFVRTVACCPPKVAVTRPAISQAPASSRRMVTLGKLTKKRDCV